MQDNNEFITGFQMRRFCATVARRLTRKLGTIVRLWSSHPKYLDPQGLVYNANTLTITASSVQDDDDDDLI